MVPVVLFPSFPFHAHVFLAAPLIHPNAVDVSVLVHVTYPAVLMIQHHLLDIPFPVDEDLIHQILLLLLLRQLQEKSQYHRLKVHLLKVLVVVELEKENVATLELLSQDGCLPWLDR